MKRADVNVGNEHGNTPLHYACFNGYESVAADLIAAGAQVMLCNKRGLTSIDVCQPIIRQSVIGKLFDIKTHISKLKLYISILITSFRIRSKC